MTPRSQPPSEKRLLDSTILRLHGYYIADRMMESYFAVFHIKRHIRHSKKLMMVCAELTNLDPSSETGLEDLANIGRR